MALGWLFATTLSGCYTEAEYVDDYYTVACDLTFACYAEDSLALLPYDSAEACASWFIDAEESGNAASDCAFDAQSGKSCIQDFRDLSCEDFQAGTYPDSCSTLCT